MPAKLEGHGAKSPVVLIDTREQRPYDFPSLPTIRRALPTGDYSVVGLEEVAAVERKELSDFVGCCCQSRARFERELLRARNLRRLWVVIEGDLSQVIRGEFRSRVNPESILGSVAAWEARHDSVRFVWASSRQVGQRITDRLLRHAWLEFRGSGLPVHDQGC